MLSRIVVEVDAFLKKEAQMAAINNDATLKEVVEAALRLYLSTDLTEKSEAKEIQIK